MTVQDVVTREQRYLKDTTKDDNIIGWINEVMLEVAMATKFPWLRGSDIVTYTSSKYLLPATTMTIESIEVDGSGSSTSDYTWKEIELNKSSTGVLQRQIELTPAPPSGSEPALKIVYYKFPPAVTNTKNSSTGLYEDVIMLPSGVEPAFYAIIDWKRLDFEEEVDVSLDRHYQRYEQLKKNLIGALKTVAATIGQKVGGTQVAAEQMSLGTARTRQQKYLRDITLNDNITDWVNEAVAEIAISAQWSWLREKAEVTYQASKGYAVLPLNFLKIESVTCSTTGMENQVLKWEEKSIVVDGNQYRRSITLDKTVANNLTLSVVYYKKPPMVAQDADLIPIPEGLSPLFNEIVDIKRREFLGVTGRRCAEEGSFVR